MRLTVEEHRESLKRFGHVKSARRGAPACSVRCPGSTRCCTRERGHSGPHITRGFLNRLLAAWDSGAAAEPSTQGKQDMRPSHAVHRPKKRPIGLPLRRPLGVLGTIRTFLAHATGSMEEIVWLLFALAFVGFAVGAVLLIYLG